MTGRSDIEGKATRVGASKPGGERVSIKKEKKWGVIPACACKCLEVSVLCKGFESLKLEIVNGVE